MNKDVISKALYLTAGLAIGSGTTYLVVKKRYRRLAEDEVAAVRDTFQRITDQKVAKAEADWRAGQEGTPEEIDVRHGLKLVQNNDYATVSEEVPDSVETVQVNVREEEEEREVTVTFAAPPVDIDEPINRDTTKPYEIEMVDYLTGENMENVVYTYWIADSTLVDERDEEVQNASETIGEDLEHLLMSDERNKRKDAIYVRNEELGVDFEIILDPRSFSKTILGVDALDANDVEEKRPPKKMRSDE